MGHKYITISFYILILVTTFDILFQENYSIPWFYSAIKMFDEIYVGLFFVYTFLFKNSHKATPLLILLGIFFVIGAVGNYNYHSKLSTVILGAYSTIKPILLFWSFAQYKFIWKDLHSLLKLFGFLFPIVVISYVLDLFIPNFRTTIGTKAQAVEIRMGLRSLGGLFNRFTTATMFGLIYFLYYKYYSNKKFKIWRILFADFMFLSSLKIKDILGFIMARCFSFFKKFRIWYTVVIVAVVFILFNVYAILMPDHYNVYFNSGGDDSNVARVVLVYTSAKIAQDNAPFGVGWGLYASPTSQQIESPVYSEYGIDGVYGLSYRYDGGAYMADTFWPMIVGETGILGTLCYVIILIYIFGPYLKGFFENTSDKRFLMPAFIFIVYLFDSIGKPVFSGPPHALLLWGITGIFYSLRKQKYEDEKSKEAHTKYHLHSL